MKLQNNRSPSRESNQWYSEYNRESDLYKSKFLDTELS